MSAFIWVRHPDMPGVVKHVHAAALGAMGASGWVQLDDTEVVALIEARRAEKAARLTQLGAAPAPKKKAPPRKAVVSDPEKNESA